MPPQGSEREQPCRWHSRKPALPVEPGEKRRGVMKLDQQTLRKAMAARVEPAVVLPRPAPAQSGPPMPGPLAPQTRAEARRSERTDHSPHQARTRLQLHSRKPASWCGRPGRIKRFNALAVPPAYQDVRYAADPKVHLQAVGRDAARRLQYRYHADWEQVRADARKAHRLATLVGAAAEDPSRHLQAFAGDAPTREFALATCDRADRTHRDPARQRDPMRG